MDCKGDVLTTCADLDMSAAFGNIILARVIEAS